MMHTRSVYRQWLDKQTHRLLSEDSYALKATIGLALLPMMSWLSVLVMALVTLRRGIAKGGVLCLAGMAALMVQSSLMMSVKGALIGSVLEFVPCFVGACALRLLVSWRAVFSVLIGGSALVLLIAQQWFAPVVMADYTAILSSVMQIQPDVAMMLKRTNDPAVQWSLACLLLGTQAALNLVSAVFSLMIARAVQARLYNPGGFEKEQEQIRASRGALGLFALIGFGAYQLNALSLSLLPIFAMYFTCTGLMLAYQFLKSRNRWAMVAVFVPLVLVPAVMVPIFMLFGTVDSLINLRLFFPYNGQNNR